jgi:hypothetical protein
MARYRDGRLAGLADRSQRPHSCPNQASAQMETLVCELRRAHPKWGAQRIVHELMRSPAPPQPLPSRATVHRILVRHGLVVGRARRPALPSASPSRPTSTLFKRQIGNQPSPTDLNH